MNQKHKGHSSKLVSILILLVITLVLSGCGSKGTWVSNTDPNVTTEVYNNGSGNEQTITKLDTEEPVVNAESVDPTKVEPINPPIKNIQPVSDDRINAKEDSIQAKSTLAIPAAKNEPKVVQGKGLYVGQIDTHSVEITTNEGPTVFQVSQYMSSQLVKIPDSANGTPVVFEYTQKEIILSGEKYIERWLTSIQPSEG
ncbi:hypothetical protein [Paenibacillus mendelii]|uniref:Uncharacterized protein n=1 Tax=Paenibacillus mendelii TaxID=206163 RepID=A0ABV6JJV1_9BACL|nr:hypothetical protein [Paenibacillus mendelii]MCQ6559118.1 hypothetical protein [Paenibacillus mendelii]